MQQFIGPSLLALITLLALVWLLLRYLRKAKKITASQVNYIEAKAHNICKKKLSHNAIKVLNRLHSRNYEAYLVGGCIRDLLLDKTPKDFDIVTNATPNEISKLFNNSRIIGRRFRIVHILFGREIIEVSTFRAHHSDEHGQHQSKRSDSGRLLRDNVYGSIENDAERRDFTVNALYYDMANNRIIDFTKGEKDIKSRNLRLIGDPVTRYNEDPVRMLRAIRFAAKLDFSIEKTAAEPIRELASQLNDIPSARLFDESLKLLMQGHGEKTIELLRQYNLFAQLFPEAEACFEEEGQNSISYEFLKLTLANMDNRIRKKYSVTPAFLYACLLWAPVQRQMAQLLEENIPPVPALQQAATQALEAQAKLIAIPKRFTMAAREIWELQYRLEQRVPHQLLSLLERSRFRAAYDFLLLRNRAGESGLEEICNWWKALLQADDDERQQLIDNLPRKKNPKRRYRKSSRDNNNRN